MKYNQDHQITRQLRGLRDNPNLRATRTFRRNPSNLGKNHLLSLPFRISRRRKIFSPEKVGQYILTAEFTFQKEYTFLKNEWYNLEIAHPNLYAQNPNISFDDFKKWRTENIK